MYSTFNCSIAAAISAGFTFANAFGAKSSSPPAMRRTSTISLVEIGFCALNKSASMTRVRFILVCADRGLNCVGDSVGVFVDLVEFAAFDQQSDLRFGPGIAKEDAPFAGELAFDFISELDHLAQ